MEEELKLDPEQQQIYDSVPAEESGSKLEPYRNLILLWKRQRRSYRRICSLLQERCGISVGIATLHGFVQRRNRPREPAELEPEPQTISVQLIAAATPDDAQQSPVQRRRLTPEEKAAEVAFLRALRDKHVVVPEVQQKPRFEYDETKPLVIDRSIKY